MDRAGTLCKPVVSSHTNRTRENSKKQKIENSICSDQQIPEDQIPTRVSQPSYRKREIAGIKSRPCSHSEPERRILNQSPVAAPEIGTLSSTMSELKKQSTKMERDSLKEISNTAPSLSLSLSSMDDEDSR